MNQTISPYTTGCGFCSKPLSIQTTSKLIASQKPRRRWKMSKKNRIIYGICVNKNCPCSYQYHSIKNKL